MNHQTGLDGEDAEPWADVCCKACYLAKNEKCVCKCNGLHHGKGNPNTLTHKAKRNKESGKFEHYYPSTEQYKKFITDPLCHCGYNLMNEPILAYAHGDGWEVEETDEIQWLFIKCPKCAYDHALWRLGVSREASIVEDEKL